MLQQIWLVRFILTDRMFIQSFPSYTFLCLFINILIFHFLYVLVYIALLMLQLSPAISILLSLYISFPPQLLSADEHPQESGSALGFCPQGSLFRVTVTSCLLLGTQLFFLLIVKSALRHLRMWLTAIQIKADWLTLQVNNDLCFDLCVCKHFPSGIEDYCSITVYTYFLENLFFFASLFWGVSLSSSTCAGSVPWDAARPLSSSVLNRPGLEAFLSRWAIRSRSRG